MNFETRLNASSPELLPPQQPRVINYRRVLSRIPLEIPKQFGEITIDIVDWDKHKQYHLAIGGFYIDCNATGGEPDIAKQMLSSKGIQFKVVE